MNDQYIREDVYHAREEAQYRERMEPLFVPMEVEMKTRYKYIHFAEAADGARSRSKWFCYNNKSQSILGEVRFYQPWRRWCYFPWGKEVYSADCLADIRSFIEQLNQGSKT